MATKRITTGQHNIDRQHNRANADSPAIDEVHGFKNIVGKNQNEKDGDVKKVTVNVLHDERKRTLAEISLARLADGAGRRIRPERLVIRASIIIAGEPEAARRPEYQQRRREQKPRWPPPWLRTKPAMRGI